jgi:transposase
MTTTAVFVGIDVSKARLYVALRPTGEQWAVANDERGIAVLVDRLLGLSPTLIVLEATGGPELPLTGALAATGLPVVVVNPRQVRDFAKATWRLAKTGGLAPVRAALYMSSLAVTRFTPVIRAFYSHLCATGKAQKVALTACMHKLLLLLNAMMKHRIPWQENVARTP